MLKNTKSEVLNFSIYGSKQTLTPFVLCPPPTVFFVVSYVAPKFFKQNQAFAICTRVKVHTTRTTISTNNVRNNRLRTKLDKNYTPRKNDNKVLYV